MFDEWKAKVGLSKDASLQDLRERAREIRSSTHPDRTGGKFKTKKQTSDYELADQIIRNIDSAGSENAVAILETQNALVRAQQEISKQLAQQQERSIAVERRQEIRDMERRAEQAMRASVSTTYLPAKIGSWTFAAMGAALVLMNDQLGAVFEALSEGDPVRRTTYVMVGLFMSVAFGFGGLIVKLLEDRQTGHVRHIMTDAGTRDLLLHRGPHDLAMDRESDLPDILTSGALAQSIGRVVRVRDSATQESTAEAILNKLAERGLAEPLQRGGFSSAFRLHGGLAREMNGIEP